MAIVNTLATAVQSPDPVLGGEAVSSPYIAGHASTQVAASGSADFETGNFFDSQSRSCRWSAFPNISGTIQEIRLRFNWSISGGVQANRGTGAGQGEAEASADFNGNYSLDGGSSFPSAISRSYLRNTNGTTNISDSGSVDLVLPPSTPLNQIMVRDSMSVNVSGDSFGDTVSADASLLVYVESIRLQVTLADSNSIIVMM